jgi:hypothetical protein
VHTNLLAAAQRLAEKEPVTLSTHNEKTGPKWLLSSVSPDNFWTSPAFVDKSQSGLDSSICPFTSVYLARSELLRQAGIDKFKQIMRFSIIF